MLPDKIVAGPLMTSRLRSTSFSKKKENEELKSFIVDAGEIPGINERVLVIPILNGEKCPKIGEIHGNGWTVCSHVYKEDRETVCYALCCK